MSGNEKVIAFAILAVLLSILGISACTANSAYQFRVGGYCNRIARDTTEWVKCDSLKVSQ